MLSAPDRAEKAGEGQPSKKHIFKHLCVLSLELGIAGHKGALRYTPHTAILPAAGEANLTAPLNCKNKCKLLFV